MNPSQLTSDVILADLARSLDDAEEFVCRVLQTMTGIRRQNQVTRGDIIVRLGIRGTGRRPNYRIDFVAPPAAFKAIDGNSHEPFPGNDDISRPENWSTRASTYGEVQSLLGELRKVRRV